MKLSAITFDVIPKYLRQLIKEYWNKRYPTEKWQSTNTFGSCLIDKLPDDIKTGNEHKKYVSSLKNDNEKDWNTATLCFIMLAPSLDLVGVHRQTHKESNASSTIRAIKKLKDISASFFTKRNSMSCSSAYYTQKVTEFRDSIKNLFSTDAENDVNIIVNARFEMKNKNDMILYVEKELECRKLKLEEIAQNMNGKSFNNSFMMIFHLYALTLVPSFTVSLLSCLVYMLLSHSFTLGN